MNWPHGEPVVVSDVTDEAESTMVSPSSEKEITSPSKIKKGVAECDTVIDAERLGCDRVWVRAACFGRDLG